jgi:hypothetical protein
MQENDILDFKSALNFLDEASKTFKTDIWIPTLQKTLSFKEINAKQQKELLSAAIDDSVYNTSFINTFYNILRDNILDEDKSIIDDLKISDKACIAINLKQQISNELTVVFDDSKNITSKIKIDNIVENFKSYKNPNSEIVELKNQSVFLKAEITLPTIKTEIEYDKEISKKQKKGSDIKTQDDIKIVISDAFIMEISKYINKIWINETEINLSSLKIEDKNKLVEKLPSGLIQKIMENINLWKKDLDSILTVSFNDYTKVISIDSVLFLN